MFSIVIPYYKKRQYIERCIDSIISQTYQNFEIILIDDGSDDDVSKLCENKYSNKVTVIKQENKGVSAARNKGIESANHDWVAFIDADDYWINNFLEEIKDAIKKYSEQKIFAGGTAIFYNSQFERPQNKLLPVDGMMGVVNFYESICFYDSPINSSNIVIKKSHLSKYDLFKVGQKNYEDCQLWMRLCVNESIVYINKMLSVYVKDNLGGASKSGYSAKDFITMMETFDALNHQLSGENLRYFKIFYYRHCMSVVLRYYKNYNKSERNRVLELMPKILSGAMLYKVQIICFFRLSRPIVFAKNLKAKCFKF